MVNEDIRSIVAEVGVLSQRKQNSKRLILLEFVKDDYPTTLIRIFCRA